MKNVPEVKKVIALVNAVNIGREDSDKPVIILDCTTITNNPVQLLGSAKFLEKKHISEGTAFAFTADIAIGGKTQWESVDKETGDILDSGTHKNSGLYIREAITQDAEMVKTQISLLSNSTIQEERATAKREMRISVVTGAETDARAKILADMMANW